MAGLMLIVNVLEKSYALSLHDNVTHLPARRALRRDVGRMKSSYALALVSIDDFKILHDRYGRDASDRVIRKIANNLRKASASAFRYNSGNFALIFAWKGRNEVLGDLETLRSDIDDFQFPLHPKAAANGKGATIRYPSARWSLTVTVGVAERGEKRGRSARYGAVVKAARGALNRGRKAGGNIVSK